MKNNRGFLLIDALFSFLILSVIVVLLYGSLIQLKNSYSQSQTHYFERIKQWENN